MTTETHPQPVALPATQPATQPGREPAGGPAATMSESRALSMAMTALSTYHHRAALPAPDRDTLAAAAPEALAVLLGLQRRLEQNPTEEHLTRCAVCGTPILALPQTAFRVDEETGQFHPISDLAVCTACVNVLRPPALQAARDKGWTRTGA